MLMGEAATWLEKGAPGLVDIEALFYKAGLPLRTPEERADEMDRRMAMVPDTNSVSAETDRAPKVTDSGEVAVPTGNESKNKLRALSVATRDAHIAKRYTFQGLPIAIEHPAGSDRTWTETTPDGKERIGTTRMLHDYGCIEGHLSGDGEELDCYIGPDENAPDVHIVHQGKAPDFTGWDEDKTMLGWPDAGAAKAAYLAHRDDGERAFRGMTTMPLDRFKAKLRRRANASTRPIRARVETFDANYAAVLTMLRRAEALKASRLKGAARQRARSYGDQVADR